MSAQTPAILVTDLHKKFGRTSALAGLNLQVDPGTVAGFLGPNGSGKSTTIRILLGLLTSDGGSATLLGGDPWRDAVELHRRIAYVPGDVSLWPNLTGGQAIDILSRLRGGVDTAQRDALLERFELDPTKKARSYSKGNRQKVALVAGLASDAELLILDEPTSGLDPLMEQVFTDCIQEVKAEGRSVLLSSHIFAEVEKLCDTVTIIREGRTVESGRLDALRHLHRTTVSVLLDRDATVLAGVPGINDLAADGAHATFTVGEAELGGVLAAISAYNPRQLVSSPPSLEDLFLRHYGGTTPGTTAGPGSGGSGTSGATAGTDAAAAQSAGAR
ncbi:ABC-2 type transport system ATP-binding protein [Arthrobacter stackebrandtii]|uniref:ABC-2 type transport system ATP-binding protein n=1 Tax=Arthrobacter stackebrandtii TaxID=272161 RepID=A0ABS4YXD6_9MICC|nr:ABC transporter ATP-binding protein [Arthrobacter stackebrandtii]MBP2413461.1 ABC-2 type transport system ATP-binding protein [Arthrobacter stackebrandtii]PYH00691.1 ABC transporter ATP-binding protein [Arthrobacter stackebrandtii]